MFDFGFLQTAAPVSHPVPLADAASAPDAAIDAGAAFDAALAATLALVGGASNPPAPAPPGERTFKAEWFLATALPLGGESGGTPLAASAASVTTTGEDANAGIEPASGDTRDVTEGGTTAAVVVVALPAADPAALPLAMSVPQQPAAPEGTVPLQAAPAGAGAVAADRPSETVQASDMALQAPDAAQRRSATSSPSRPADGAAGDVIRGDVNRAGIRNAAPVDPAASAGEPADAAAHAIEAAARPSTTTGATQLASAPAPRIVHGTPGPATHAPVVHAGAPDAEPAAAAAGLASKVAVPQGGPGSGDANPAAVQARTAAHAAFHGPDPAIARAAEPGPATSVPVDGPSSTAATALAAAVAVQQSPAPTRAINGPESAEAPVNGAGVFGTSGAAGSGDAAASGDQFAEGQPKQSPEFMRFAAALAQVGLPAAGEHGPAAAPVVTAVASSAAATPVTAATPVMPAAPAPALTPEAENLGNLVQAMRIQARSGAWEATVRLKPEHLGDVTISLRVDRNTVSAVVNADAAGVRQWLESQEQAVRSGMAEHGLHLERFVVQRDGQRRDPHPHPQQHRQPKPQPQNPDRFEIVV